MSISIKELKEFIKKAEIYGEKIGKNSWNWKNGYDCAIYQVKLLIKKKKQDAKK